MIDDSQRPTRHVRETSSYGDLEQDANLLKSAQQRGLSEEASLRQLKMRRDPELTSEVYEKFKAKPQHDPKTYLPGPEEEEFAFDESGPTQVGPSEAEARRLAEEDERYVAGLPPYKQQSARAARKAARQAEMRVEQPNYYDPTLPEAADEPAAEAEAAVEKPGFMAEWQVKDGTTYYRPKNDPYRYSKDAEGTFTAYDGTTGMPVMTVPKGHANYTNFEAHFEGKETKYTRSKAAPPAPDEAADEAHLGGLPEYAPELGESLPDEPETPRQLRERVATESLREVPRVEQDASGALVIKRSLPEQGFRAGDRILAIDGTPVENFPEDPVAYLERRGSKAALTTTPAEPPLSYAKDGGLVVTEEIPGFDIKPGERIVDIHGVPVSQLEDEGMDVKAYFAEQLAQLGDRLQLTIEEAPPPEAPSPEAYSSMKFQGL